MSSMVFASLHRWWSYKHLLLYHNYQVAELKEFFLDPFSGRAIFSCRVCDPELMTVGPVEPMVSSRCPHAHSADVGGELRGTSAVVRGTHGTGTLFLLFFFGIFSRPTRPRPTGNTTFSSSLRLNMCLFSNHEISIFCRYFNVPAKR